MRKLVLFAVLGGVFGLALLLEHFVTRPGPRRTDDADHLVAVFGGLPPREIPATPPDDPDAPAAPATNRGGAAERSRGAGKPPSGGEHSSEPPLASAKEHVVARGETLASIARVQLGSANRWRDLALWNGIADPGSVPTGAHLRLAPPEAPTPPAKGQAPPAKEAAREKAPAAGDRTYRVAKGDTLSRIAAQYLGDASRWREIQRLNNIPDPANLNEGRMLQLPQR